MAESDRDVLVALAVVVERPNEPGPRHRPPMPPNDQRARLVQALLTSPTGREIEGVGADACLIYPGWHEAVGAACGLLAELLRLPRNLADFGVRIGIDIVDPANARRSATRVVAMAGAAGTNEIRIGRDVARRIAEDPPDRLVVRAVPELRAERRGIHRLVAARDDVPTNLVDIPTSFVGRRAEAREIVDLLERDRLVTITGPPGAGKTRLAIEVASRILGRFTDGAWFVPLASIGNPELVLSAVATAFGIPVPRGLAPGAAVMAHLQGRRVLLVLDNFEHLVSAGQQVIELLEAAPHVRVLVTSQVLLGVAGETQLALAPFGILESHDGQPWGPGVGSAIDLFVDRAAASQPADFNPQDRATVAEICRRLDGLPLAIELAAARARVLPLAEILERLDVRLADFGDETGEPDRHRSLRAAIGWSYDLLDSPTQRLFRYLSVFRGGWTSEAAADLAGGGPRDDAIFAGLASLQGASLIVRSAGDNGSTRFGMLETLRQFAAERLADANEVSEAERRFADQCIALAEQLGQRLVGPDQATALDRLATEHDNLRAALGWLLAADPVGALRIGAAIWRFWQMRGHLIEGSRWVTDAITAAGTRATADQRANGRTAAGGLAYWRGDLAETEAQYLEVVHLRRAQGDAVPLADALFDLAFVFDPSLRPAPEDPERSAAGVRIAEEAHAIYVAADHEPGIARTEWLLGSVIAGHNLDRATALLSSSTDRFRRLGDPFGLGWALHSYGLTLLRSTDSGSAAAAFAEALGSFASVADGSATALLLDDFAEVARAEGDALRAARLKGSAARMRASTQADLAVANAPWLDGDAVPRGMIDPEALGRAWAEGNALSATDAIAYALGSSAATMPDAGLRISALGPLVVERSGEPVTDWGGPKAGNRHALAIFAFLMDRGERGVTKDEFVEVLWPDAELEQGDLNFHRTLGGLRSTLAGDSRGGLAGAIVFANGRYRLAGAVVGWLDVAEFEQRMTNAAEASDDLAAIRGLEAARSLYRGDYLDDCPLYGDSVFVEERRRFLRGRFVDVLVDLGRRYALRHDRTLASARYHEALHVTSSDCPAARDGLLQLGVSVEG